MSNELIFFLEILICLGAVLIMYKLMGKNGLFAFAVFGTLLGNVAVCKCVEIFGLSATGGNVIYAATFLVTDILSEKYGKAEANKAVKLSFAAMLMWLVGTQFLLLMTPASGDMVNESLKGIFSLAPRVTLGSLAGFACSQTLDVFLYHFIWNKTGNSKSKLWLRNNLATLISQAVDTMIFTFIAFWGLYDRDIFMSILLTTYVFKVIVAICDTPFLYLARKITPLGSNIPEETRDGSVSHEN